MIMVVYALLNGVLVALARALNGRLAVQRDALFASWINHLVGFAGLTVLVVLTGQFTGILDVPPGLYLGGVIGAVYVILNSYIVPRLGVTIATLLVIAGQLGSSIVLDLWLGNLPWVLNGPMMMLMAGSALAVFGFYLLLRVK